MGCPRAWAFAILALALVVASSAKPNVNVQCSRNNETAEEDLHYGGEGAEEVDGRIKLGLRGGLGGAEFGAAERRDKGEESKERARIADGDWDYQGWTEKLRLMEEEV